MLLQFFDVDTKDFAFASEIYRSTNFMFFIKCAAYYEKWSCIQSRLYRLSSAVFSFNFGDDAIYYTEEY